MDASIGKYQLRMEDAQLIITHKVGISFDFTIEEALGICSFITMYRQSLENELILSLLREKQGSKEGHFP